MENIRLQSLQILYTFVLRLPQNGRLPVNMAIYYFHTHVIPSTQDQIDTSLRFHVP